MLEALSPDVEALVAEHNAEALDHFLGYIHDYIVANVAALPLQLCYVGLHIELRVHLQH